MTERDYAGEMAKLILDAIPEDSDYTASSVALTVYETASKDPELLQGWLAIHAVPLIAQNVTARRSHLARTAQRQKPTKFQDAVASHEAGDPEPLSVFKQCLPISPDHIVRPIGDFTKADALYVSECASKRAKTAAFESAFYKAVANKIPDNKVLSDVMTEVEFLQLRESLNL